MYIKLKPIVDKLLALCLLVLLAPLFLLLFFLVAGDLGWPIFFHQERPGRQGKLFMMYKFRTMRESRDDQGQAKPDHDRLSWFGRFLRSASLDEIPELINVLRGEMSFIGPRPLLTEYLPLYNQVQSRRHEVLPGITGWAQVNGRNAITWEKTFELDVWYVDHLGFLLDLKIIWLTILKVFLRKGINEPGLATRSRFTGTKQTGSDV